MITTYTVKGMTCNGCRTTVEKLLSSIANVTKASVVLETETATIESDNTISFEQVIAALAVKSKFTIAQKINTSVAEPVVVEETKSWISTYFPLLLIVVFISVVSAIAAYHHSTIHWMQWMNNFMAGFFLVFSFFKFLNLKGFANSYAMYDVVAKKSPVYGFVYPFIELGLGIAYLINFNPQFTNIATIIVMGVSVIGVIESNINKRKIKCACLGAVFNLPMSTVTIIEDLVMIAMAAVMLFYI
jgi:cation transport ATPase